MRGFFAPLRMTGKRRKDGMPELLWLSEALWVGHRHQSVGSNLISKLRGDCKCNQPPLPSDVVLDFIDRSSQVHIIMIADAATKSSAHMNEK